MSHRTIDIILKIPRNNIVMTSRDLDVMFMSNQKISIDKMFTVLNNSWHKAYVSKNPRDDVHGLKNLRHDVHGLKNPSHNA